MPYPLVDLVGQTFGRLTVLAFAGRPKSGQALWNCQCVCGKQKVIYGECLKRGSTTSCGCFRKEDAKAKHTTHGGRFTPDYRTWQSIKSRCLQPNHKSYSEYGQRGIQMCDQWVESFEQFIKDMGPRPEGTTIDRINVNGHYEPGNCKWSTPVQQANNRRNNKTITFNGKTQTWSEWGRELGIDKTTIRQRANKGWSPEQCLAKPS